ncbi:MAG: GTPase [Candidatus Micrarchaeota archaeon]|nr:GTPase [Candidatus Micrarchaeota archaeon]
MSKSKRGMSFGKRLNERWTALRKLLRKCEIVLEILDARDLDGTRMKRLEHWAGRERLIKIANKCDLLDKSVLDAIDKKEFLRVNSKASNREKERKKILDAILAMKKTEPRVLVIGYPNVGKSSVINLLAGKEAARAAPIAGTTTNIQWIRLPYDILLMDTPGVFPEREERTELLRKGSINVDRLEDFEFYGLKLAKKCLNDERLSKWLETYFYIKLDRDTPEELLEKIAKRRGWLLKGGLPNKIEACKALLRGYSEAPKL